MSEQKKNQNESTGEQPKKSSITERASEILEYSRKYPQIGSFPRELIHVDVFPKREPKKKEQK